jgi:hypothetical protein
MNNIVTEMRRLRRRHHIPAFLKKHGLNSTICEVGVYRGENLKQLLACASGTVYAVDPWMSSKDPKVTGGKETQADMDAMYQSVLALEEQHLSKPTLIVLRMTSEQAATKINTPLDFVYIDACHSYEAVKADIGLWWPKIRPGGILSGHDYVTHKSIGFEFGVVQAVDQFVESNQLKDQLAIIDTRRFPSWMIYKEGK